LIWASVAVGGTSSLTAGLPQPAGSPPLHAVRLRDVTLHYVAVGRGEPVVMVHGGLEDYRAWSAQLASLASRYRAVAYSRRYNFPNRNETHSTPSYSAQVDADDLAMVIEKLHLGRVNLVGHSYGGLAALLFATEHPELVRSLTLSEPPVFPWVEEQPGDAALVRDFFRRCWLPVTRAFARHQREEALAITTKYFTGNSVLPPPARAALEPNLREWEVLTTSDTPFPVPSTTLIKEFHAPLLLLTGDHTLPVLKRCVAALSARFPESERVVIRNAAHDMWSEKPQECGVALRKFLHENSQTRGARSSPRRGAGRSELRSEK
jgi:non-heme chloroperoxidase